MSWAERLLTRGTPDLVGPERETWMDSARCAETDPDAFFPDKGESAKAARKVCGSCEVQAECLEYALKNDYRYGIYGGASPRERAAMRQRRES